MITLDVMGSTLSNLVSNVVTKRETGALKRRRASPVRASALISGDVITSGVSALTITVVLAQVLPVRPLATAVQAAIDPVTNGGRQFAWPDLLIVLAWGAAGTFFAVRRFSWSPSGRS
jgi:hypothetical protein